VILDDWFASRGWTPFAFQREVWDAYANGESGLVHAATGTGKTLAAWGGPIAEWFAETDGRVPRSVRRATTPPLRVLWITPLRALAADTEEALRKPIDDLGIPWSLESRTGDTSAAMRARQRRRLPTALITTPESLSLLLTREDSREIFADLRAIVKIAKARGILTAVDNTFASPYNQQPLALGIDIVVHSATKYLNGHSDVIGGVAIVSADPKLAATRERLGFLQNSIGAIASPFDSFLALRGLKTLALRMQRHNDNALELARWLERDPKVARVYYPGLPSHPQHALANAQMRDVGGGYGGMISIELATDLSGTKRFLEAVHIFALAESLGGVESLIEHPAIMTHATIPPETRAQLGIGDSLVRLSVGVEDVADLRDDLAQALDAV